LIPLADVVGKVEAIVSELFSALSPDREQPRTTTMEWRTPGPPLVPVFCFHGCGLVQKALDSRGFTDAVSGCLGKGIET
jgi:hypothetical protein